MWNPNTSEAVNCATYVEDYIDAVENLPDDVQRQLSRIREIYVQLQNNLRDVDHDYHLCKAIVVSDDPTDNRRAQAIGRMQQSLIAVQTLADENIEIVRQMNEMINNKTRQLDADRENLGTKENQQQNDVQEVHGVYSSEAAGSANGASTSAGSSGHGSISNDAQPNADDAAQERGATINQSSSACQRTGNRRSKRLNKGKNAMKFCTNKLGINGGTCGSDRNSFVGISGGTSQKQLSAGTSTLRHATPKSSGYTFQGRGGTSTGSVGSVSTAGSGIGSSTAGASGKKKKRNARGKQLAKTRKESPPPDPIDPNEPRYCLCDRIAFGEMILCDNDLCPIEWFHFACVTVVSKPKGKWYCPKCRADRPNVMKPMPQFLKELERYNKEKEEKF